MGHRDMGDAAEVSFTLESTTTMPDGMNVHVAAKEGNRAAGVPPAWNMQEQFATNIANNKTVVISSPKPSGGIFWN